MSNAWNSPCWPCFWTIAILLGPLGKLEIVSDFLPPPERFLRDDGVKVTISLSKHSVDFFKRHAARSKVPYQKMIRSLLDGYVKHHETEL